MVLSSVGIRASQRLQDAGLVLHDGIDLAGGRVPLEGRQQFRERHPRAGDLLQDDECRDQA